MTGNALPSGVIVAPATPMDGELRVDYDALADDVERLIAAGVHGLTPCAITAEAETLDLGEHQRVLQTTVEAAAGRVPVYCGIGRPSILELRTLIDHVHDIGGDGLFLITPYASAHTPDEASAHFLDVVDRAELDTIIYNCPGYSGVHLAPELISDLADHSRIVGIKEGHQPQLAETVQKAGDRLAVLTARDSYLMPSMTVGAVGVVSFAANVEPEAHVALYDAIAAGDLPRAERLHQAICDLVDALVARSYPVLIKEAMHLKGRAIGSARRVATPISSAERLRIAQAIDGVAQAMA